MRAFLLKSIWRDITFDGGHIAYISFVLFIFGLQLVFMGDPADSIHAFFTKPSAKHIAVVLADFDAWIAAVSL